MMSGAYFCGVMVRCRLHRAIVSMAAALALAIVGMANAEAEPLTKRLPRLKSYNIEAYENTEHNKERLREFVNDVLKFVLMHETGHMVFREYQVPMFTRATEEGAADDFAAAVLTDSGDLGALQSSALFWDALAALGTTYDWSDEHGPHELRAYKAACLLYGANPAKFAQFLEAFPPTDEGHQKSCRESAKKNQTAWVNVISPNRNPNAGKPLDSWTPRIAVVEEELPSDVKLPGHAGLSEGHKLVQTLKILDFVAKQLVLLKKTERDQVLEIVQKKLNRPSTNAPLDLNNVDMNPIIRPFIDHLAKRQSLEEYNYSVVGSNCPTKEEENLGAFWNPNNHSITLCYSFVAIIETIGKLLIAADDCSRTGRCERLGRPAESAPAPPTSAAENLDPALVGTWALMVPTGGYWILEIRANGTYAFHSEANDGFLPQAGTFSTKGDGTWTLQATDGSGYQDRGTYKIQPPSAWSAVSQRWGPGIWYRVPTARK